MRRALDCAKDLRLAPPVLAEGKKFLSLLTKKPKAKVGQASGGPGVLEHRVSPRLEWLTDMGVLSKQDLPRNGFEYLVTPDAKVLLDASERGLGSRFWAENVALSYSRGLSAFRLSKEGSAAHRRTCGTARGVHSSAPVHRPHPNSRSVYGGWCARPASQT